MIIEQNCWSKNKGWESDSASKIGDKAQLLLVFGSTAIIKEQQQFDQIRTWYPNAQILGCSTAGEIYGTNVLDDSLTLTAIQFDKTAIRISEVNVAGPDESFSAGQILAEKLNGDDLVHVFVLSDGLNVNGSNLVHGLMDKLSKNVAITGGLSGDGANFKETYVILNDSAKQKRVVALGLYSKNLKVGYGSLGGWDSFGPERKVTKSKRNVLYELDGESALGLYKKYLGEHAKGLPSTGLLFPLSLRITGEKEYIVRTILAVDEESQSMTFAGDVPENSIVRLMKANFDRLIDGAVGAAKISTIPLKESKPQLAILISCVGRKLILKQRIEEEIEGVQDILSAGNMTGFYSYGEISPLEKNTKCELHNQTMTITVLTES